MTSNRPVIWRPPYGAGRPESGEIPLVARQLTRAANGYPLVERIDLAIHAGEVVALLGANGAGKTTLLKCLAGRLKPTAGEVLWYGQSPVGRPASHALIGFAAHEGLVYPELTAGENLLFAARMYSLSEPRQRVTELLAKAGLTRHSGQVTSRLSQGLRRRLSLARALVHDPPIVILDEPSAGLDAEGRVWMENWLGELRERRRAIIFSSHDERQSQSLADRTMEVQGGRWRSAVATAYLGSWSA